MLILPNHHHKHNPFILSIKAEDYKQSPTNMKTRANGFLLITSLIAVLSNYPLHSSAQGQVHQVNSKAEAAATNPLATPVTNHLSPPEGNTTFLEGRSWCVALPMAPQLELQVALNWACGPGGADCRPIQPGGPCFQPDMLVGHASYAFNSYYQQNGNNDVACYFGGTAVLTKRNPSYGKCNYDFSENLTSLAASSVINDVYRVIRTNVLLIIFTVCCIFAWW